MTKSDNTSLLRAIFRHWLVPVGVSLTALSICSFYAGVYIPYEFVRNLKSQHSLVSVAYEVVVTALTVLFPMGLLTTLVGSLIWARRGEPGNVLGAGLGIVLLILLAGHFIHLNGEADPIPVFVFLVVMLIAAIFITVAFLRFSGR